MLARTSRTSARIFLPALVAASLALAASPAFAQSWIPDGDAYYAGGVGMGGGYGLVTNSGTCAYDPDTCPWGVTYGGADLVGGPGVGDGITEISFWFKASTASLGSGGSPRLVFIFDEDGSGGYSAGDGIAELRPLVWTGDWQFVDGMAAPSATAGWDFRNSSAWPGFHYNTSWASIMGYMAGVPIIYTYVVNDSGWMVDPEQVVLDGLNVDGILGSPGKEDCKHGGWETLGFRNQGQCVSSFVSNRPED